MKELLIFTSVFEGLTGLVVLAAPAVAVRLLFGSDITGAGALMSQLVGVSLIALAVACWPDREMLRPMLGMLTYGALVTLFLVYVGINGTAGILLWPAVVLHTILSVLLVRAWQKARGSVAAIV
jgi:hypothetical protein